MAAKGKCVKFPREALRGLKAHYGRDRTALAEALGLPRGTVAHLLNGTSKRLRSDTALAIRQAWEKVRGEVRVEAVRAAKNALLPPEQKAPPAEVSWVLVRRDDFRNLMVAVEGLRTEAQETQERLKRIETQTVGTFGRVASMARDLGVKVIA